MNQHCLWGCHLHHASSLMRIISISNRHCLHSQSCHHHRPPHQHHTTTINVSTPPSLSQLPPLWTFPTMTVLSPLSPFHSRWHAHSINMTVIFTNIINSPINIIITIDPDPYSHHTPVISVDTFQCHCPHTHYPCLQDHHYCCPKACSRQSLVKAESHLFRDLMAQPHLENIGRKNLQELSKGPGAGGIERTWRRPFFCPKMSDSYPGMMYGDW